MMESTRPAPRSSSAIKHLQLRDRHRSLVGKCLVTATVMDRTACPRSAAARCRQRVARRCGARSTEDRAWRVPCGDPPPARPRWGHAVAESGRGPAGERHEGPDRAPELTIGGAMLIQVHDFTTQDAPSVHVGASPKSDVRARQTVRECGVPIAVEGCFCRFGLLQAGVDPVQLDPGRLAACGSRRLPLPRRRDRREGRRPAERSSQRSRGGDPARPGIVDTFAGPGPPTHRGVQGRQEEIVPLCQRPSREGRLNERQEEPAV